MNKRIEFIESYIKQDGDADYVWNDNHGVLVRCKDCKHYLNEHICQYFSRHGTIKTPSYGYCCYGEAREENE